MASTFWMRSQMVQGRYLYAECTQTPNVADNTSTIHWTLAATGGSSSFYTTGPTQLLIGGKLVYSKERVSYTTGQFPAAKGSVSGSLTVAHDSEGNATVDVTIYTMIYNGVQETRTEYWTLDPNPTFAQLKTAPNFHDEEDPVITYRNPAGSNAASLQACISLDGSEGDIPYRDIPKDADSYIFSLTEAERDVLRGAFPNSNSGTVQFLLRSAVGGNTQVSSLTRTFTIKAPQPVIQPVITDSNDATFALTGNRSKLIRYYSNAAVTTGAAAVKKATLKSQKVTCGQKSLTADGTVSAVESGSFVFTATDSRGNTATKTVEVPFVEYIKPTCHIGNHMPDADGNFTLTVTGNYFNGSFGAKNNTILVQYRYKAAGGSYSAWTNFSDPTISGNSFTATKKLTGLDYQTTYVFQAWVGDALYPSVNNGAFSTEKSVKAEPVFDWDQDDFNFNVPVHASSLTLDTPLSVANGGAGMKLPGLSDYHYAVIPLCKLTTTDNAHLNSGTQGIIYLKRDNGLDAPKFLMIQAENQYSGAYRFNISIMGEIVYNGGMTATSGYGFRTCRFQYNSVWYGGIALMISNANYGRISFVGTTENNTVTAISIYNRNTGEILNSEIYNSLSYDYGDFKNGLYRNTGAIGLEAYPVNSIYISYSHTSPAALFGGTWTRIQGYFLLSSYSDATIGATGGEKTHTLTADEMPKHKHDGIYYDSNGQWVTLNSGSSGYRLSWTANGGNGWQELDTGEAGGGAAHNNMPPYIHVSIWRRTA